MKHLERVIDANTLRDTMTNVYQLTREQIGNSRLVVIVTELSKSRLQEKKYHALIRVIAKQVVFGRKRYSPRVWKAKLVEQFSHDRAEMDMPLRYPATTTTSLDGRREITVRPSTTDFSVSEAKDFIEFLYATGIELGVCWPVEADQLLEAERMAA